MSAPRIYTIVTLDSGRSLSLCVVLDPPDQGIGEVGYAVADWFPVRSEPLTRAESAEVEELLEHQVDALAGKGEVHCA